MNSIGEKLKKIAENEPKVYEAGKKAGKKAEYDAFWDGLQNYGNRTNYQEGFRDWAGAEELNPKYPIKSTTLYSIFGRCYTLKQLPTVECANSAGKFESCYGAFTSCKKLESIDFDITNKSTSLPWQSTFYECEKLKRIKKIVILENQVFSANFTFGFCGALEEITVEGTIGQNGFDIHWSTKLTAKSLYSIINTLSTTTTGLTITLPTTAEANYNANPPENAPATWAELVATRSNWTIAYA